MPFPANHDFTYYRGDTYEFDVVLKNSDGTDFVLTPFETLAFSIATQRGSSGTKTSCLATNPANTSIVRCTITSTTGRGLAAGQYYYDVQITDTTPDPDTIYTVLTGTITVIDDIIGS